VTVITADGADGPVGMSCNSFTSVSLDPPLIAVFPAENSSTWPAIRQAGHFCVNVLASGDERLARAFAVRGTDRFAGVNVHQRVGGPGLDEAVVWLGCQIYAEHEAGDHTLVLGKVLNMEARPDANALVFFKGRYGPAPIFDER
jgi:3-hydroxy-9,10-secoandrosta-1,3,5(10)-triene-9,17-dione monooxygenase reductase component